jgi:hypothetical protein
MRKNFLDTIAKKVDSSINESQRGFISYLNIEVSHFVKICSPTFVESWGGKLMNPCHRYITSRSNMSISADVQPWGAISLLTAPPPTTSGVKSY